MHLCFTLKKIPSLDLQIDPFWYENYTKTKLLVLSWVLRVSNSTSWQLGFLNSTVEATLTLKNQKLFHSIITIFELEYWQISFITEMESWSMLILDQNYVQFIHTNCYQSFLQFIFEYFASYVDVD